MRTFPSLVAAVSLVHSAGALAQDRTQIHDLSLLVAPDYPCTWPAGFPVFQLNHFQRIGPASPYHVDILTIDGNTGTQLDVPPHSIPRPNSKLPNAGPLGEMWTDKIPAWQFCGEACVIDVRDLLDDAVSGRSPLIEKPRVVAWEKQHRAIGRGDVVLFRSDYSDRYYRPLPAGRRFVADPVEGTAAGFPNPSPECMDYVGSRGVMGAGTDSPSMGPIPDLAEPTHLAGLKYGMIWTEGATGLGKLPNTGAFYCMLGPKHAGGPYGECRALAIVGDPLAKRLIDAARQQRVLDLSVTLAPDLPVTWPGRGVGNHRHPYLKVDFLYAPNLDLFHHTHMMDAQAGTHLVPPSYALPPAGFDNHTYASDVRRWLSEFEQRYGPRGTSDLTAEKVALDQTCGPCRVVDVTHRVGTTQRSTWPASPEIRVADIAAHEQQHGELKPGEIVLFHSGHSDRTFQPMPRGAACLADPLAGRTEGWPAIGPDVVLHLAKKGIRCIGSDAPTVGGVEPRRALETYWSLGTQGMVAVEFLTGLSKLPDKSYFIFAPVKIRDCHGGPGRAIALYDAER